MVLDDLLVLLIYYYKPLGELGEKLRLMPLCLPSSSVHGILQAKSTGVGCHALLQGIFLTQGSSLKLLASCITGRFFATEPPGKGTPSSLKVIGS